MFTNNFTLCRLIFRRDRLRILLWFAGIAALVVGFGAAVENLFGTDEGRASFLAMMDNPAMVAMMGPIYLTPGGEFSLGAMYSLNMVVWSAMIMAFMNIFHVVRHTRQDEERGRIEVIRSLPVGRLSNLSATMTSAVIINTAFALLLGLGLGAVGTGDMSFGGAMLFGAAMGACGLVFAAITAIFCQLNKNSGTAMSISFAVLGGAFMLRAVGDMQGSEILACISPFGLIYRARIYTGNEWWPIFVSVALASVLTIVAFRLCVSRDMGEGLIPARQGRKDAKPYLKSPGGLAWRLLRMPFIVWAILIPILSASYGSIMGDIESLIESTPVLMQLTGGNPMAMVGFLMIVMSICSTIPILQFMLKARSQESRGYVENVLARSASRNDQLRGYFLIALLSSVLMPFLNCAGFYAASSAVMEEPIAFVKIFEACMVYVPAMMFMLGAAVLLIGYLPKYASFAYAYLGYAFGAIYLGGIMGLPEWIGKLSPFGHTPMLPNDTVDGAAIAVMLVMTALAVGMFVFGFIGHRRRDMKFSQ